LGKGFAEHVSGLVDGGRVYEVILGGGFNRSVPRGAVGDPSGAKRVSLCFWSGRAWGDCEGILKGKGGGT